MNKLESVAYNLMNGNLTEAKRLAKTFGWEILTESLMEILHYSGNKAIKAVTFLKNGTGWQELCDTK